MERQLTRKLSTAERRTQCDFQVSAPPGRYNGLYNNARVQSGRTPRNAPRPPHRTPICCSDHGSDAVHVAWLASMLVCRAPARPPAPRLSASLQSPPGAALPLGSEAWAQRATGWRDGGGRRAGRRRGGARKRPRWPPRTRHQPTTRGAVGFPSDLVGFPIG